MPDYVVTGDPIPPEFLTAAGINRLLRQVDELRAILAPLLDAGTHFSDGPFQGDDCLFCGEGSGDYGKPPVVHKPDCPVLRRDELLGRSR